MCKPSRSKTLLRSFLLSLVFFLLVFMHRRRMRIQESLMEHFPTCEEPGGKVLGRSPNDSVEFLNPRGVENCLRQVIPESCL